MITLILSVVMCQTIAGVERCDAFEPMVWDIANKTEAVRAMAECENLAQAYRQTSQVKFAVCVGDER